jgi:hypothetical protein
MVALVFRHLLPCSFLLPSHRHRLQAPDPHGRAAYKLLALVPVSCDPPATPLTPRRRPTTPAPARRSPLHSPAVSSSQAYPAYLADARAVIRTTAEVASFPHCYNPYHLCHPWLINLCNHNLPAMV